MDVKLDWRNNMTNKDLVKLIEEIDNRLKNITINPNKINELWFAIDSLSSIVKQLIKDRKDVLL